jgi:two-component system chemotaxis sensor kinase CheA
MDVVKRGIESLQGNIKVSSIKGVGTSFRINLPRMMAITNSMLVAVGSERYLVPTLSTQKSVHANPDSLKSVFGRGEFVIFQGEPIPILRLCHFPQP